MPRGNQISFNPKAFPKILRAPRTNQEMMRRAKNIHSAGHNADKHYFVVDSPVKTRARAVVSARTDWAKNRREELLRMLGAGRL